MHFSFNDIHELKCGQAEEKLEAGGDEKLIFNFIWPNANVALAIYFSCLRCGFLVIIISVNTPFNMYKSYNIVK